MNAVAVVEMTPKINKAFQNASLFVLNAPGNVGFFFFSFSEFTRDSLSLIECSSRYLLSNTGHPSCVDLRETNENLYENWRCIECKICEICQETGDDVCGFSKVFDPNLSSDENLIRLEYCSAILVTKVYYTASWYSGECPITNDCTLRLAYVLSQSSPCGTP